MRTRHNPNPFTPHEQTTNFLAHLWLAERTQTSLAGSVLGDVVRGADLSAYPPDIALGIRLHRKVDATTDRHPLMVDARRRFPEGERRYAGVILDLAADHALAQRWPQLSHSPSSAEALTGFSARCGLAMAEAGPWFVHAGGRAPAAQGFADLLMSYASAPGIERAIQRTATRMREPDRLLQAGRHWMEMSVLLQPQIEHLMDDLLTTMRLALSAAETVARAD